MKPLKVIAKGRVHAATVLLVLLLANSSMAQARDKTSIEVREAFTQTVPRLAGDDLKITLLEVTYPPGGSSAPHRHPCPVIVYVVAGAIRSQADGGPEKIYKAGEVFYEAPNGLHSISANASLTEPARFIACFLNDREAPLSSPATPSIPSGGHHQ
jgi:quercetin dioxygenase-like cupin family protein